MVLLKAVVSREDLKYPVSAEAQEVGRYDDDQDIVVFLTPLIDMMCQLATN